jgi:hypothetical protein
MEDIPAGGCMFNTGKNRYALERDKFCGQPAVEGKPYCEGHCKRAYRQWNLKTPKLNFDPHDKGEVLDFEDAPDLYGKMLNPEADFNKKGRGKIGKKKSPWIV